MSHINALAAAGAIWVKAKGSQHYAPTRAISAYYRPKSGIILPAGCMVAGSGVAPRLKSK